MKYSKNYRKVAELVDAKKVYSIEEACELVKKTSTVKFDATIDVSFHFDVDPTQADQQVRGTLIMAKRRRLLLSLLKSKTLKLPVRILSVVKN